MTHVLKLSKVNKWGLRASCHDIIIFNGSHFDLPPSSVNRMTGLIVSTLTYSHRPQKCIEPNRAYRIMDIHNRIMDIRIMDIHL